MNIELLADLIRSLLLERNEVVLPGLGTFVAEEVPAGFSDKGFTINPPYRRLSLRQRESEDSALAELYAARTGRSRAVAGMEVTGFIFDVKEMLKERKTVELPGLGRLRATRENHFFFVPDEEIDIYPDGFALESISLKFHQDTVVSEPLISAPAPPEYGEVQDPLAIKAGDGIQSADALAGASDDDSAGGDNVGEGLSSVNPATLGTVRGGTMSEANGGVERSETFTEDRPLGVQNATLGAQQATLDTQEAPAKPRRRHTFWWIVLIILLVAALFLGLLALLGRVAPELVDPLLYNADELAIIRHP